MNITQDGEQTIIDGEGNKTFVKHHSYPPNSVTLGGMLSVSKEVQNVHIKNFNMERLTGNPFKDCWRLLRWYFRK
jgi:hypothetical protein